MDGHIILTLKSVALIGLVEAGVIQKDDDGGVDTERFERFWRRFQGNLDNAMDNAMAELSARYQAAYDCAKEANRTANRGAHKRYLSSKFALFFSALAFFFGFLCGLSALVLVL